MKNLIFVQIAAYRDPELLPTLRDCIAKAKNPENLRICVAWQHAEEDTWDTLEEFKDNPNFSVLDIDYKIARGVCWARNMLNAEYNGEKFTLQLDSHHRFSENWDAQLIKMFNGLKKSGHKKPLLTAYLPSYDPTNEPTGRVSSPWFTSFDRFSPDGNVHFMPQTIDDWKERTAPIPARFVSGHFIFTLGKFCQEVEYDTAYYFHGEEINLSVRAYLAGYDLFHPNTPIIWHEYTRSNKKKHWDDHTNWDVLNTNSHNHNRQLLGIDGVVEARIVGKERTLTDYELYAGLEFRTRKVHKRTIKKEHPPIFEAGNDNYDNEMTFYHKFCLDLYKGSVPENDYAVWVVAFKDAEGTEIYREDVGREEVLRLMSESKDDKFAHIWRSFYSDLTPTKYIIWPCTDSKGWLSVIEGTLLTPT